MRVFCRGTELQHLLEQQWNEDQPPVHLTFKVFPSEDVIHVSADSAETLLRLDAPEAVLLRLAGSMKTTQDQFNKEQLLRFLRPPLTERIRVVLIAHWDPNMQTATVHSFYSRLGVDEMQRCDTSRYTPHEASLRTQAIVPSKILANKHIAIFGVGSVGSFCAIELAKNGIGKFTLIDYDDLNVANVTRHACDLRDVGRLKTRAVRDQLINRNPTCAVHVCEVNISNHPAVAYDVVSSADLVIAATDNNRSRLLINRACLTHVTTCLFGRVMVRGSGGDILRLRPGFGPCYGCLLKASSNDRSEEISQQIQAAKNSYGDLNAAAEPGLSIDVAPISVMIARLAMQELLRGEASRLSTTNDDLKADFYIWANRREERYENWPVMGNRIDGLAILRWYGVRFDRNESCPSCGAGGYVIVDA